MAPVSIFDGYRPPFILAMSCPGATVIYGGAVHVADAESYLVLI